MQLKTFLIPLENLKSLFGNFAYVNEAEALQQISSLQLSFKAQPSARAKLFMKLPTRYFCDPVRDRVGLLRYHVFQYW